MFLSICHKVRLSFLLVFIYITPPPPPSAQTEDRITLYTYVCKPLFTELNLDLYAHVIFSGRVIVPYTYNPGSESWLLSAFLLPSCPTVLNSVPGGWSRQLVCFGEGNGFLPLWACSLSPVFLF